MPRHSLVTYSEIVRGAAGALIASSSLIVGSLVDTENPALASTISLCQSVPSVTQLVVTRHNEFLNNQPRFSFSSVITVHKASPVRDIAHALCALPDMPVGIYCPADIGISYRLNFMSRSHPFAAVTINASGCEDVDGLHLTRWAARSQNFWPTFGRDLMLSKPNHATFIGGL